MLSLWAWLVWIPFMLSPLTLSTLPKLGTSASLNSREVSTFTQWLTVTGRSEKAPGLRPLCLWGCLGLEVKPSAHGGPGRKAGTYARI